MIRIQGSVAIKLQASVAARADELVVELFDLAFSAWEDSNFNRYDETETSCTIRFFDCADQIVRADAVKWALVRLQYDGPQPTPEIRSGQANPNTSPRPDLILFMGGVELSVEAKRVGTRKPLPADYVNRGMSRFLGGKYAVAGGCSGHMIGYILKDDPSACVREINKVIAANGSLGAAHRLLNVGAPSRGRVYRYQSLHGPKISLGHHHYDMR